jgi:geranylgeranyl reductase family protein
LIVGAGPAGAWAARRLAQAGARVLMFDGSHPREKPCGGGLTSKCLALLGPVAGALTGVAVTGVRFEAPPVRGAAYPPRGGAAPAPWVRLPVPARAGAAPLVVVDRAHFDAVLLESALDAGARLIPERVTGVEAGPAGAVIRTKKGSTSGRLVIGADGAASLVRHQLGTPLPRSSMSAALGVYVHGVAVTEIEIRFVSDPPGYIWSFPRVDHLAVGICAQADVTSTAALRQHLDAWLTSNGLAAGRVTTSYAWPIPAFDEVWCRHDVPSGPGWMVAGDAAGLVDPLTREGIYYALRSGELAADAIAGPSSAPWAEYAGAVRREMLAELARAVRARTSFFWPVVSRLWIDALQESPQVSQLALDVVLGNVGYERLRRTALRRLEPGAAWRIARRQAARRLGVGLPDPAA